MYVIWLSTNYENKVNLIGTDMGWKLLALCTEQTTH